ncbi:hypothetical protein EAE96_007718 [Botrytis aclada]|nr:hypothetical protein EAE96_007718 [Botrytis aclada]
MLDHGSQHSSEGDSFKHRAYGATHISCPLGMGKLNSPLPARGPVPQVRRSLYDPIHCGACDAWKDGSDEDWKRQHINESIDCRDAYWKGTCEHERLAYATMPDSIHAPGGYIPPTQISQRQYSNPRLQIRETRAYSSNPPVSQSETQSAPAYLIPHSPQYLQEQQHSNQRLSPNAYQTNHPSAWLHSSTHPSQPDQRYAQYPTEIHDNSYTSDASHHSSPAYDSEAQRAPAASVSASQGRGHTTTTRDSSRGRHRRRGTGRG